MKLFDVQSAAEILGISRQSVNRLIADGALHAVIIRAGRRKKVIRIPDTSLRKFLNLPRNEVFEPAVIHEKSKERNVNVSFSTGRTASVCLDAEETLERVRSSPRSGDVPQSECRKLGPAFCENPGGTNAKCSGALLWKGKSNV
jgi:hypothetical protein